MAHTGNTTCNTCCCLARTYVSWFAAQLVRQQCQQQLVVAACHISWGNRGLAVGGSRGWLGGLWTRKTPAASQTAAMHCHLNQPPFLPGATLWSGPMCSWTAWLQETCWRALSCCDIEPLVVVSSITTIAHSMKDNHTHYVYRSGRQRSPAPPCQAVLIFNKSHQFPWLLTFATVASTGFRWSWKLGLNPSVYLQAVQHDMQHTRHTAVKKTSCNKHTTSLTFAHE